MGSRRNSGPNRAMGLALAAVLLLAAGFAQGASDCKRGDIIVAAGYGLLMKVDPVTGVRTVLSDFNNALQGPTGFAGNVTAIDCNAIYATDQASDQHGKLFKVLPDGTRTLLSDAGIFCRERPGTRPLGSASTSMAVSSSPIVARAAADFTRVVERRPREWLPHADHRLGCPQRRTFGAGERRGRRWRQHLPRRCRGPDLAGWCGHVLL